MKSTMIFRSVVPFLGCCCYTPYSVLQAAYCKIRVCAKFDNLDGCLLLFGPARTFRPTFHIFLLPLPQNSFISPVITPRKLVCLFYWQHDFFHLWGKGEKQGRHLNSIAMLHETANYFERCGIQNFFCVH